MKKTLHQSRYTMKGIFQGGWRLLVYLLTALLPALLLAVGMNIHFRNTQLEEETRILSMGFTQVGNQLSYLYHSSSTLAQNLSMNTTLKNEVLTTHAKDNDFLTLHRNILHLHELTDGIQHSVKDSAVRFYLPSTQIIPDNTFLFSMQDATAQPWYAAQACKPFQKKWNVSTVNGQQQLSYVFPLQDPNNYLEITGFLSVDLDIAVIDQLFTESMAIPGTLMFLSCGDEIIHASTQMNQAFIADLTGLSPASLSSAGSQVKLQDQSYMAFLIPVEASDMSLLCCVPQLAMSQSLQHGYYTQLLLMVVEVLLLLVISFWFASSVLRQRRSELKMLNYQINPHFLYNTLDMINWHAIDQDIPAIYQPIQALSRFYKIMLNHGQEYISLADELQQIRLYLELQNMRFQDGVSYRIEAPADLAQCQMLHLVLQPIVENAVIHGIRETGKQYGAIDVKCSTEKNRLVILIRDDGVGIPPQQQKHMLSRSSSKGYGLSNVHQRIKLYYGAAYGLSIVSEPSCGTAVRVTLPLHSRSGDDPAAQPICYTNRPQA